MCLIVHKPAGRTLPAALLESAAEYNPHGAGMVALGHGGHPEVRRSAVSDVDEIRRWLEVHTAQECILHFRYRTRGEIGLENTHPLQVTEDIVLFHNGRVPPRGVRVGHRDESVIVGVTKLQRVTGRHHDDQDEHDACGVA
jgi:predicted glutamine amidotransferase